jgi:hypothetical protein
MLLVHNLSTCIGPKIYRPFDTERKFPLTPPRMADVVYLPTILSSKQIDIPFVKYLDSGEHELTCTPQQWAKSLMDSNGKSLEVDMENRYAEGKVVLILPSVSL